YKIITPLETRFQETAYNNFKEDEYFPGNTEGVEGAFVMMDQKTGGSVAALGGRQFEISDLDSVNEYRQPGSAMKPLAEYGSALMDEKYNPNTMLPDENITIGKDYSHKNHDNQYEGSVSLYEAIVKSKNVAPVWLLNEIGLKTSKSYLKKMNMDIKEEDLNLALALGGLTKGFTPINLAEGYRTFAAKGEYVESYTVEKLYNRKNDLIFEINQKPVEVFSEQVAWAITEMLQTAVKRGTASSGYYPKALAGKTGSTQNPQADGHYKDAWFVGYTPEYITSMWMGYDISDEKNYLVSGSSSPTRLTKKILTDIDQYSNLEAQFKK